MAGDYFRVEGADLETGEESYLVLQAAAPADAESVARTQGLLISLVRTATPADWGAGSSRAGRAQTNGARAPARPDRPLEKLITFERRARTRTPVQQVERAVEPRAEVEKFREEMKESAVAESLLAEQTGAVAEAPAFEAALEAAPPAIAPDAADEWEEVDALNEADELSTPGSIPLDMPLDDMAEPAAAPALPTESETLLDPEKIPFDEIPTAATAAPQSAALAPREEETRSNEAAEFRSPSEVPAEDALSFEEIVVETPDFDLVDAQKTAGDPAPDSSERGAVYLAPEEHSADREALINQPESAAVALGDDELTAVAELAFLPDGLEDEHVPGVDSANTAAGEPQALPETTGPSWSNALDSEAPISEMQGDSPASALPIEPSDVPSMTEPLPALQSTISVLAESASAAELVGEASPASTVEPPAAADFVLDAVESSDAPPADAFEDAVPISARTNASSADNVLVTAPLHLEPVTPEEAMTAPPTRRASGPVEAATVHMASVESSGFATFAEGAPDASMATAGDPITPRGVGPSATVHVTATAIDDVSGLSDPATPAPGTAPSSVDSPSAPPAGARAKTRGDVPALSTRSVEGVAATGLRSPSPVIAAAIPISALTAGSTRRVKQAPAPAMVRPVVIARMGAATPRQAQTPSAPAPISPSSTIAPPLSADAATAQPQSQPALSPRPTDAAAEPAATGVHAPIDVDPAAPHITAQASAMRSEARTALVETSAEASETPPSTRASLVTFEASVHRAATEDARVIQHDSADAALATPAPAMTTFTETPSAPTLGGGESRTEGMRSESARSAPTTTTSQGSPGSKTRSVDEVAEPAVAKTPASQRVGGSARRQRRGAGAATPPKRISPQNNFGMAPASRPPAAPTRDPGSEGQTLQLPALSALDAASDAGFEASTIPDQIPVPTEPQAVSPPAALDSRAERLTEVQPPAEAGRQATPASTYVESEASLDDDLPFDLSAADRDPASAASSTVIDLSHLSPAAQSAPAQAAPRTARKEPSLSISSAASTASPLSKFLLAPLATLVLLGGVAILVYSLTSPQPKLPNEIDRIDLRLHMLAQMFLGGVTVIAGLLLFVVAALFNVSRAIRDHYRRDLPHEPLG